MKHIYLIYFLLEFSYCATNFAFAQDDSFTVIILSDTQYYSQRDGSTGFPETYMAMTNWVADNTVQENIAFTIHMGDVTQTNSVAQWEKASAAHDILDAAGAPYSVVPGNHDYPGNGNIDSDDSQRYNEYFGPSRFETATWYGGAYQNDNDNNYCFFSSGDYDFMVISLEFAPSKDVLCWANNLIEQYPEHNIIIATHCYQTSGGDHRANCATSYDVVGSDGRDIWKELARQHSNVQLVLSGHVSDVEHHQRIGNAGNVVNEILTDYQREEYNGQLYGNGWLRKLIFNPSEGTINVESFSVLEDVEEFNHEDYPSDPEDMVHKYRINDVQLNPSYSRVEISKAFNDMNINTASINNQIKPVTAMAANGDFVVVWEDNSLNESEYQVFARSFYANGCEKHPDILVNQISSGNHLSPDIAINEDSSYAIAWQDDSDGNGISQIKARMFDEYGIPLSANIDVSQESVGQQRRPRISADQNKNFVVVWEDDQENDGLFQAMSAGFNNLGLKTIEDHVLNENLGGQHVGLDVSMLKNGNYIVVWQDDVNADGSYNIRSKGYFSGSDQTYIPEFTVNQSIEGQQLRPKVDTDDFGEFSIVWEDDFDENESFQIYGASFDNSGQRISDDFAVNLDGNGQHLNPSISKIQDGRFLVSWQDDSVNPNSFQIRTTAFDANNSRLFNDIVVNENNSGQQISASLAASNTNWVVTWEDDLDEDGNFQVLGRGYDMEEPEILESEASWNNIKSSDLIVSPNPNNGSFSISSIRSVLGDAVLEIYDLKGRKIHNEHFNISTLNWTHQVQGFSLNSGMYILNLINNSRVQSTKFIVWAD